MREGDNRNMHSSVSLLDNISTIINTLLNIKTRIVIVSRNGIKHKKSFLFCINEEPPISIKTCLNVAQTLFSFFKTCNVVTSYR